MSNISVVDLAADRAYLAIRGLIVSLELAPGAVIDERELMQRAFDNPGVLDRPVSEAMGPPLPTVGAGEPVQLAVDRLEQAPGVVVIDAGHPVGILTRSDLLDFLARRPPL